MLARHPMLAPRTPRRRELSKPSLNRVRSERDPGSDILRLSFGLVKEMVDWLSPTAEAYIAAGAPGKRGSCHLFRHTAATLMLEGGADSYVSEMLGHAKLETTALYTRVSIAKLRTVHATTHPAGNDTFGADIRLLQPVPGAQQTS